MGFKPPGRLRRHLFESTLLGNTRQIWIQAPLSRRPQGMLVFLDAEHYLEDLGAAETVEQLLRRGEIGARLAVYVSHIDYPTRWRESFCNPDFAAFLSDELIPWAARFDVGDELPNAVVGLSLTGLAAVHAALLHPKTLHRVLSQSGSFWWQDGWLIDQVVRRPVSDLALRLSVGRREVDEDVDHGDQLFQKESQLSANRRMRDAIATKGFRHLFCEFDGGHDLESFRRDLPDALRQLEMLE